MCWWKVLRLFEGSHFPLSQKRKQRAASWHALVLSVAFEPSLAGSYTSPPPNVVCLIDASTNWIYKVISSSRPVVCICLQTGWKTTLRSSARLGAWRKLF